MVILKKQKNFVSLQPNSYFNNKYYGRGNQRHKGSQRTATG